MTRDLPTLSQAHRELEAHDDAHELVLYAENTGELYSEKKKLERFLSLQWKRNGYKPTAALVAWRLFAKRAAKRYEREIKGSHFHVERGINVAAAYWEAALRDELMRESRKTMNDPRRSSRDKRRRSLRERIAARNEQNKRIGAHVYRHPMDHTAGMGDRRFENPQRGFAVQSFEFKTVSDGRYVAANLPLPPWITRTAGRKVTFYYSPVQYDRDRRMALNADFALRHGAKYVSDHVGSAR